MHSHVPFIGRKTLIVWQKTYHGTRLSTAMVTIHKIAYSWYSACTTCTQCAQHTVRPLEERAGVCFSGSEVRVAAHTCK